MHEQIGGAARAAVRLGSFVFSMFAAALLILSIFLPKLYCDTIRLSHGNRMIDGWEGVAIIGCAAVVLASGALGLRWRGWGWLGCAAGVAVFGVVLYASTGARLIVQGPVSGVEGAVYAEQGTGLVVAALGALTAVGAGLVVALRGSE
jgi:hypothetical protein